MIDANTSSMIVRNDSPQTIRIPRNFRLGHVKDLEFPNTFYASGEDVVDLALWQPKAEHKTGWFKKMLAVFITVRTALNLMYQTSTSSEKDIAIQTSLGNSSIVPSIATPAIIPANTNIILPNSVTIHKSDQDTVDKLTTIVNEFFSVWVGKGFANLPEDNWM